jgi:sugar phosphate isomerase/epimerase
MAVEFSPLGPVEGIRDGLDVVEIAGRGAGLLVDVWHFSVGPSTWQELEALSAEQIAYIQFSDGFPPQSTDLFAETMNRRTWPGAGAFELDRFVDTVRKTGFDGYASLELLNGDLRTAAWSELLGRAYGAMKRYWLD